MAVVLVYSQIYAIVPTIRFQNEKSLVYSNRCVYIYSYVGYFTENEIKGLWNHLHDSPTWQHEFGCYSLDALEIFHCIATPHPF